MSFIIFFLTTTFFSPIESKSIDYTKSYYPYTTDAEYQITLNNYRNALVLYKKAFSNVRYVFNKDYFNASICATLEGDSLLAIKYLQKYYNQTKHIELIENHLILRSLIKHLKIENTNQNEFIENLSFSKKKYSKDLDSLAYLQSKLVFQEFNDNIREFSDSTILFKFIELIKKNDFPSEIDKTNGFHYWRFEYLLASYMGSRFRYDYDIKPLLRKKVKEGLLSPILFANLIDNAEDPRIQPIYGSYVMFKDVEDNRYYYPYRSLTEETKININREKLGIGTLAMARKICQMQINPESNHYQFTFEHEREFITQINEGNRGYFLKYVLID